MMWRRRAAGRRARRTDADTDADAGAGADDAWHAYMCLLRCVQAGPGGLVLGAVRAKGWRLKEDVGDGPIEGVKREPWCGRRSRTERGRKTLRLTKGGEVAEHDMMKTGGNVS